MSQFDENFKNLHLTDDANNKNLVKAFLKEKLSVFGLEDEDVPRVKTQKQITDILKIIYKEFCDKNDLDSINKYFFQASAGSCTIEFSGHQLVNNKLYFSIHYYKEFSNRPNTFLAN
jgi:hypothetical protein